MLSLQEVTRENWRASLELTVFPEQHRFIANYVPIAAIGLAKAYIRPGGLVWVPYVFYNNEDMIGFTELAYEPGSLENYWIFHFFIDHRYQGERIWERRSEYLASIHQGPSSSVPGYSSYCPSRK